MLAFYSLGWAEFYCHQKFKVGYVEVYFLDKDLNFWHSVPRKIREDKMTNRFSFSSTNFSLFFPGRLLLLPDKKRTMRSLQVQCCLLLLSHIGKFFLYFSWIYYMHCSYFTIVFTGRNNLCICMPLSSIILIVKYNFLPLPT